MPEHYEPFGKLLGERKLGGGNENNKIWLLRSLLIFQGGFLRILWWLSFWAWKWTEHRCKKIWILVHLTLSAATCRDPGQVYYTFHNRDYPQN